MGAHSVARPISSAARPSGSGMRNRRLAEPADRSGPIEIDPDSAAAAVHNVVAGQAASDIRSVDFSRAGFPPGGFRGDGSRLDSASRISSMETVRLAPGMARKDGHDAVSY